MARYSKLKESLTFDDVLLVPRHSKVLPKEVDVTAQLTKSINLNIPILSAAMDTVTESAMAVALAREGGMGVIHKNMSVDRQVKEVTKVKRAESGIILDPVTISPDKTLKDAIAIMKHHEISGLPVIGDSDKIIGILTERDIRFESNLDQSVIDVMTKELITAKSGTTLETAKDILQKNRIEKLLLIDKEMKLAGMVTVRDILMKEKYPNASLDPHGRLLVAAAVGVADDLDERVSGLIGAGVDVIVLDSAHGHSQGVLDAVGKVKSNYNDVPVIAGNVATGDGTRAIIDAGADSVKVGLGAGASCTTRVVSGIGVPQFTAIVDAVEAAAKNEVPVISDGGIRFSGDMAKAMAAGADCVMLGNLLSGLDESPGEVILHEGRQYKSFRGMGSIGTMREGSADRYFQEGESGIKLVPEGVEGLVPYRGSLSSVIYQLVGGLRASMGYCGVMDIPTFKKEAEFIRISSASYAEGHPHDLRIVKDAPNYQPKDS
ncbi:MAG TPA: IMP dehydrogenase [Candidatus Marinimicrobia bacterium]|nr:IMP dehydrogenase [Candidatus Neomarinimicrobiota bacterium]